MTTISLLQRLGKDLLSEIYSYDDTYKQCMVQNLHRELFWYKWNQWFQTVQDPVFRTRFHDAVHYVNCDRYNFQSDDVVEWKSFNSHDDAPQVRTDLQLIFSDCAININYDRTLSFDYWGEGDEY